MAEEQPSHDNVTPHPALLRERGKRESPETETARAKVLTIASGKGGVGKTNVATNLAITLAREGARVCLLDADTGLANVNVLLGFQPEHTIEELLTGELELEQLIVSLPQGIDVVPAGSGLLPSSDLHPLQRHRLVAALACLERRYDYLIIDAAAGIGALVIDLLRAAAFPIIVVTAEPTSLTDAYALLKRLGRAGERRHWFLLVNDVSDFARSRAIYQRLRDTVSRFLGQRLLYLGFIPHDAAVTEAVRRQVPVVRARPDSPASRCYHLLAKFLQEKLRRPAGYRLGRYWEQAAGEMPPAREQDRILEPMERFLDDPDTTEIEAQTLIEALLHRFRSRFGINPEFIDGLLDEQTLKALPTERLELLLERLAGICRERGGQAWPPAGLEALEGMAEGMEALEQAMAKVLRELAGE